jgi:hypothetical protein
VHILALKQPAFYGKVCLRVSRLGSITPTCKTTMNAFSKVVVMSEIQVKGTILRVVDMVGGDCFAYVALEYNPGGRPTAIVRNRDCVALPECGWLHRQFNKLHDALAPRSLNRTLWRDSPPRRAPKPGDIVEGCLDLGQKDDLLRKVSIWPRP